MKNRRGWLICATIVAGWLAPACAVWAFNPPRDTVGALTVQMTDPGPVTRLDRPVPISVTLTNAGDVSLAGTVRISVNDDWRITGVAARKFVLAAQSATHIPFQIMPGRATCPALYPVHARVEWGGDRAAPAAHAILILSVTPEARKSSFPQSSGWGRLNVPARGAVSLLQADAFQTTIAMNGEQPVLKSAGWLGSDAHSGGMVSLGDKRLGDTRRAIGVHPPWRGGWGETWLDYRLILPAHGPLTLCFATAVREIDPRREKPSDGVDYRVLVSDGGEFQPIFARFSPATQWEPARVDLSAYAGREITLRLSTGPGPAHNTNCDQAYWAEPVLWAGVAPSIEPAAAREARRVAAAAAVQAALTRATPAAWTWKFESAAGLAAAAVVPGPNGLADASIAFATGAQSLVFDGFDIRIDDLLLTSGQGAVLCESVETSFADERGVLTHWILKERRRICVRTTLWGEKGALRMAFSMPGQTRDARGEPRFTQLMIGPASMKARRVYAGFGNVLEDPGAFDLPANGFRLATRHIGLDFAGGLSLVQASDVFPDRLIVDPATPRYALVTHHDATFSFLPSERGAFAAARAYREIANFKPAPGVAHLAGRMCLDQWGGAYRKAAEDLEKAARYGLTNAVFVKHSWQRWGYDYRLPDIYPPAGDGDDFLAMVAACQRNGLLFCPHDNYIDFYPDAEGFSYDHIVFDVQGTPRKGWLNEHRQAQAYTWLPTAFMPWLERNLRLIKKGFAPNAYFVDVFSAAAPMDFYDRRGRFYSKNITAEKWGAAFDRIRSILGGQAPMISEAGTDALIGHLDAGQSDHIGWRPDTGQKFAWTMPAKDGERVPWHDMVSHRSFVLFAGGLGSRYADGDDAALHGYGSDDYLSMTVLGGRNPMSDGPFSRQTVMTYWLLNAVCAELGAREMQTHAFAEDDIHRQIVTFHGGGRVCANRGGNDWRTDGVTLPPYGFVARAGDCEADVTRREGIITGFARRPGELFADARPVAAGGEATIAPRIRGVESPDARTLRILLDWDVRVGVTGFRPFLHVSDEKDTQGEGIVFHGTVQLDPALLAQPGVHAGHVVIQVPEKVKAPATLVLRLGLFQPSNGQRVPLVAPSDATGRARIGTLHIEEQGLRWEPEPPNPMEARWNVDARLIDFGPVSTDGAFRLRWDARGMELTPLPHSPAFKVVIRPESLGWGEREIASVTALDMDRNPAGRVPLEKTARGVRFVHENGKFAYRIEMTP